MEKFLKGHFEAGLEKLKTLNPAILNKTQQMMFCKIHHIYLLGQLLDLPTLHSILTHFGINSNAYQVKYNRLKKELSMGKIFKIYECLFQHNVREALNHLYSKDSSIFSKISVTLILDDSVFKQYLPTLLDTDTYYGKFFSGQYKSTQYGFKLCCLGVSIDKIFYPLFVGFVPKKVSDEKGKNTALTSEDVAIGLVQKWSEFVKTLHVPSNAPHLHLSCDSGYSSIKLSNKCKECGLHYISVAKKSHLFSIDGVRQKLYLIKSGFYVFGHINI